MLFQISRHSAPVCCPRSSETPTQRASRARRARPPSGGGSPCPRPRCWSSWCTAPRLCLWLHRPMSVAGLTPGLRAMVTSIISGDSGTPATGGGPGRIGRGASFRPELPSPAGGEHSAVTEYRKPMRCHHPDNSSHRPPPPIDRILQNLEL